MTLTPKAHYVLCPETITSPAPDRPDLWPANLVCGERCEVIYEAPVMDFRCPKGHAFYATPDKILRGHADAPGKQTGAGEPV